MLPPPAQEAANQAAELPRHVRFEVPHLMSKLSIFSKNSRKDDAKNLKLICSGAMLLEPSHFIKTRLHKTTRSPTRSPRVALQPEKCAGSQKIALH